MSALEDNIRAFRATGMLTRLPVAPVIVAYALAFAPTYLTLAQQVWSTEQEGHGPFILAAALWLAWRRWPAIRAVTPAPAPVAGWATLILGLLLLVLGRSQDLLSVEVFSQVPIIAGLVLVIAGWRLLRLVAIPVLFLLFTVPPPGSVVDAITLTLKARLSDVVTDVLYRAGYPIAQNGVILTVGPYELLVKDACAGMNSIFSLSAISIFYIILARHASLLHNLALYAFVLPVSFIANAIRVLLLVLLTYHFGNAAGQGLFHDLTGVLLFTAALLMIFLVDSLLSLVATAARQLRRSAAAI